MWLIFMRKIVYACVVLKNKLGNLKSRIKQWSIQNGDVNNNKILQLKQKLHEVDLIAQDRTL